MKTIRLILSLCLVIGGATILLAVDGPLTNALNLRVRTDANGYLVTSSGTYTAPDGPLTAFANLRLRTDANGYLISTLNGNSTIPVANCYGFIGVSNCFGITGTSTAIKASDGGNYLLVGPGTVFVNSATLLFGTGGTPDVTITRAAANELTYSAVAFAALGTPANGTFGFCSDCAPTTPATCPATKASCVCTSGGTGAFAVRLNGVWDCGTFQ